MSVINFYFVTISSKYFRLLLDILTAIFLIVFYLTHLLFFFKIKISCFCQMNPRNVRKNYTKLLVGMSLLEMLNESISNVTLRSRWQLKHLRAETPPAVNTLPSLIAITLMKLEIKVFQIVTWSSTSKTCQVWWLQALW